MNNLKCRHWANKIYLNNPNSSIYIEDWYNPVSKDWFLEIKKNNPKEDYHDEVYGCGEILIHGEVYYYDWKINKVLN